MGLCKCPKRKVTNLFCFEHRVNVCEHCLVSNHNNCVVQSYLNWLKDSDYNPNCTLCHERLDDDNFGPCVRLMCYDIFHWSCLNRYAVSLPATTAPAGYQCPNCKGPIFPPANASSPVADRLKDLLTKVNWARAGLGLPLIDKQELPSDPPASFTSSSQERLTPSISESQLSNKPVHPVQPTVQQTSQQNNTMGGGYSQPQIYSRTSDMPMNSARSYPPLHSDSHVMNISDHDMDKYKRRSAFHFLSQWFKSRDIGSSGSSTKKVTPTQRRFFIIIGLALIGFLTIIVIFSRMSRNDDSSDELQQEMMDSLRIKVGDKQPSN